MTDPIEAFIQSSNALPEGVLPIRYQAGTELPFAFIRELDFWPAKGKGLSADACGLLFAACGVAARFGEKYHATALPTEVDRQIEHARDFAYRFREDLLKKAESIANGPNPARAGFIKTDQDGCTSFQLHPAWAERPWNEQTAIEMFLSYGLDPEQAKRWYSIYGHLSIHPRFDTPFDPAYECAVYAHGQAKDIKLNGKATYRMGRPTATIPAPVDFDWVYVRFRANKLWGHNAKWFWQSMDEQNWSTERGVLTPEEIATLIDQECRAEHDRRSRLAGH